MDYRLFGNYINKAKIAYLLVIFLLLFLILGNNALAEETLTEREDFNIVFVVDHSGSMNSQSQSKMIPQIFNLFIDTSYSKNIQIGYVGYNDTILTSYSLTSVQSEQHCRELKELISATENKGETDIGLGLKEAYEMLKSIEGPKMIVLLSDGETDLKNSHTGRTNDDSDQDVQRTLQNCIEEKIKITTIAFGQDYKAEELQNIASQTGGNSYCVQEAEALIQIFEDILCENLGYTLYEMGSSIYGEGNQKISCECPENFDEATLILWSDKEIQNVNINDIYKSDQTVNSQNYIAVDLGGVKGNLSVSFRTKQEQRVMVFAIGRQSITPALEWTGELHKNKLLNFQITFEDINGNSIDKPEYYESAKWSAEFENLQTGELIQAKIQNNTQGLSGTVNFEHSGEYVLNLSANRNGQNFCRMSGINILNTLPVSVSSKEIELLTISSQQAVNLNDYFADSDGDELVFELQEVPKDIVKAELQGNSLLLTPERRGRGEIKLLISDGEGNLIGTVSVRIKYLLEAYWQVVAGLLCIIVFCMIKLYKRKRSIPVPERLEEKNDCSFTGKLNAYFTRLPDGMEEIPPLAFALHPIRDKKIALSDMFSDYTDIRDLLMLDNIFLFPAENRKMILYQDSDANVMIGNSIVCRKMQYIVGYGNVIYITSKDGTCELEVHYISMI